MPCLSILYTWMALCMTLKNKRSRILCMGQPTLCAEGYVAVVIATVVRPSLYIGPLLANGCPCTLCLYH